MKIKSDFKRKSFLLIELLVATALMGVVMAEGMYLLVQQTKSNQRYRQQIQKFFLKEQVLLDFQNFIWRIDPLDDASLRLKNGVLELFFDAGSCLDPELSGFQRGIIKLEKGVVKLIYMRDQKPFFERVLLKEVQTMKWSFYNQKSGWRTEWDSSKMDLPEMMRLELVSKQATFDQKALVPFNIEVLCN